MAKSITVLAIAMLLGLGVIFTRSSAQQESNLAAQHKLKKDRKDESRSVYKGRGHNAKKLTEAAAEATGDIGTTIEPGLPSVDPFARPFTINDHLRKRGCDADAIVIATIKSGDSFLTEDETFLYTNHKVTVEDVLKDNPASPLHTGSTATVTRTGGTITLSGKRVTAVYQAALPFQINKRYLLFLTYLPERESYVADNLSYLLENEKLVKTTKAQGYPEEETGKDSATFIQTTRNAMSYPCPETEGGLQ